MRNVDVPTGGFVRGWRLPLCTLPFLAAIQCQLISKAIYPPPGNAGSISLIPSVELVFDHDESHRSQNTRISYARLASEHFAELLNSEGYKVLSNASPKSPNDMVAICSLHVTTRRSTDDYDASLGVFRSSGDDGGDDRFIGFTNNSRLLLFSGRDPGQAPLEAKELSELNFSSPENFASAAAISCSAALNSSSTITRIDGAIRAAKTYRQDQAQIHYADRYLGKPQERSGQRKVLATLEIRSRLSAAEQVDPQYISDKIRTAALRSLPKYSVITRENMLALVEAQGRTLEECDSECEVETGRKLGADIIVAGEIRRFGSNLKLDLRMFDTVTGELLNAVITSGANADALDTQMEPCLLDLFSVLTK